MNYISQNKTVYDRIAPHFASTRSFLWKDIQSPIWKQYLKPGDRILDIGCGNGRLYQLFADISIEYTGIDQSGALIDIAKKHFPEARFLVGEMTRLPFPDQSFDLVYAVAAFHHLVEHGDQIQALTEMKRVLKSGGRIIMLNWNLQGEWGKGKLETGNWKLGNPAPSGRSLPNFEKVFLVPWKNGKGESFGDRIYYGFRSEELEALAQSVGLITEKQWYTKHGKKSNQKEGENIVSIFCVQ